MCMRIAPRETDRDRAGRNFFGRTFVLQVMDIYRVAHQLSDTITRTPPYLADNAVWQVYSLRSGFTGYQ